MSGQEPGPSHPAREPQIELGLETDDHAFFFVHMWADAVVRQVERVRAARRKSARDSRNYERNEDWSPTEADLGRDFRAQWAEEHTLVWQAHQLEKWKARLAHERGEPVPPKDEVLSDLRNALEHLDEAQFQGDHALPGTGSSRRNRSLRRLQDGRIEIVLGGDLSFRLINPEELEARALSIVTSIEDRLLEEAEDQYLSMYDDP